jgi:hypothetical protein
VGRPDIERYRESLHVLEFDFSEDEEVAYGEFAELVGNCDSPAWNQLVSFFWEPVWQRMWIVQELVLSKEIRILVDDKYLPYLSVSGIAKFLGSPKYIDRIPVEAYRGAAQVTNIVKVWCWRHRGALNLLSIWYKFGWCGCHRARDKIFAILNITTNDLGIRPDYEVDIEQLFCGVSRRYISQQNLRILGHS